MNAVNSKMRTAESVEVDYSWKEREAFDDAGSSFHGKSSTRLKERHGGGSLYSVVPEAQPRGEQTSIEEAMERSCQRYIRSLHPDGYWWSELESNVTITSEYVMLMHLLGIGSRERERSVVKYLLNHQREDGSWGLCHGDKGDISATAEAYFALKLTGRDPRCESMRKAREFVLSRGGLEACRVFSKIWLALFGQYDWDKIPSMPVELVLLPEDFYFNIYEFSSWARETIVPLSIVMAIRPTMKLRPSQCIAELYVREDADAHRFPTKTHKLFYLFDRVAKAYDALNPFPALRQRAVKAAEDWTVDHQEPSGDWGGIQPPMVYSLLALHYLGYSPDHPVMKKGLEAVEAFCLEDELGFRMQSCISPVWDTALTALAMLDAGVPAHHPALEKVTQWLVDHQILEGGDWQCKNCCAPGGWAFEFVNNKYPDVDDSAVVLMALQRLRHAHTDDQALECAGKRGMDWCISMQSTNGGWAAFDRDNVMSILNRIPFADHEAMVDDPTADVSGRVLEAMGLFGYDKTHPVARRGIEFIRGLQEEDGSWWGRWGVNHIYGTWSVLRGLISIGEDPGLPYIQAAVRWLKDHQNPDGGWGEVCESYADPRLAGKGPSTASQTAWAIMGLLACGEERSPEVQRGIEHLIRTQEEDGSWEELYFTGTGFPRHFYIRYHNYRNCFPLMALGQFLRKR